MSLGDDLNARVSSIINGNWDIRNGSTIPTTETVALEGGGVKLDATVLYADLAESSLLASEFDQRVAAKIVKCFLACATKIIRASGGAITSFDGDRVMGIYIGDSKNTNAAKSALKIKYCVTKIIKPKIESYFESIGKNGFKIAHAVGIDTSPVFAVRAGQRSANDLIWVGRAPNLAAKLSTFRESGFASYITDDVFNQLNEKAKFDGNSNNMWESSQLDWFGEKIKIHKSNYWWNISG